VPSDRRTEDEIRRDITSEREQLVGALGDLREGVDAKRRTAATVGGALGAMFFTAMAFKILRRVRSSR
jgi:hypothetical protein